MNTVKRTELTCTAVTEHPLMEQCENLKPMIENAGVSSWGDCSLDVLLMVFEKLEPVDLMNCLQVNSYWRDAVNYMAEHCGLWKQLAQAGMVNKGIDLRRRSNPKLDWKDLYINYRLWRAVKKAHMSWSYELSDGDIKHLHVYKDILITELEECYYKKYYHIKDHLEDITSKLTLYDEDIVNEEQSNNGAENVDADGDAPSEILQDSEEKGTLDDLIDDDFLVEGVPISGSILTTPKESSFMSDKMIKMLVKEAPFTRLLVLDEDCYYMLNQQNILRCVKWDETNQRWLAYVLARYYMCNKSISDISVYNDDVYMLLKTGLVFKLDRSGRNFLPDRRFNAYLTPAQFEVSRMIYGEIDSSVERAATLPIPEYGTGTKVMFHDISVVVSVPWDKEFKMNVDGKTGNIVIEYPGLSCATQHGEMIFLGFLDGKVEICIAKNLIRNGGKCEIATNVQNCADFPKEEHETQAIVSIEVFEDLHYHHIFVATDSSVYRLTVTHPQCDIYRIGLDKDSVAYD